MRERSFANEVRELRKGDGEIFEGEGICPAIAAGKPAAAEAAKVR